MLLVERYRQPYWLVQGELSGGGFSVPHGDLNVWFSGARVSGVDFSGLRFSNFWVHDSVFENCRFGRTVFERGFLGATFYGDGAWDRKSWPESVYRGCTFERTYFQSRVSGGNARFERCVFDRARLPGLHNAHEAQFVDCTFRGKLRSLNFFGVPSGFHDMPGRARNDFTGNDFTGAALDGVAFKQIDLYAQKLPGLPGYALLDRVPERVAAALAVVAGWPDDEVRAEATWALRFEGAQSAVDNDGHRLVSRAWLGRKLPPEARDAIFDLLTGGVPRSR